MSLVRWWLNLFVPPCSPEHDDWLPEDPLLSENQGASRPRIGHRQKQLN
ncbi:MAG: hypothetical protein QOC79_3084, partial [Actinomycetota bacterium]|nr:hypothetical protein [Actinomycetota bacterium]